MYVGECEFCGEPNRTPGRGSEFTVRMCHGINYVACGDSGCRLARDRAICDHELSIGKFCDYVICGNAKNIVIPRSGGSVSTPRTSIGEAKRCPHAREAISDDSHLRLYVDFVDDGKLLEKSVKFVELAKHNLHMPVVLLTGATRIADAGRQDALRERRRLLINRLIMYSRASRLVLVSHIKDDGMFALLPAELVRRVFAFYYNLD